MLNLREPQKKCLSQSCFLWGFFVVKKKKNSVRVFQYTFPGRIVHVLDGDEPKESFTTYL